MTGCSKLPKPKCVEPCKWTVGKGCKKIANAVDIEKEEPSVVPSKKTKAPVCSKLNKATCVEPCKWVTGKGCHNPLNRRHISSAKDTDVTDLTRNLCDFLKPKKK